MFVLIFTENLEWKRKKKVSIIVCMAILERVVPIVKVRHEDVSWAFLLAVYGLYLLEVVKMGDLFVDDV